MTSTREYEEMFKIGMREITKYIGIEKSKEEEFLILSRGFISFQDPFRDWPFRIVANVKNRKIVLQLYEVGNPACKNDFDYHKTRKNETVSKLSDNNGYDGFVLEF